MKHKDSQRWKLTQKDLNDHVNEARKWREEEIALEMIKHDLDDAMIVNYPDL